MPYQLMIRRSLTLVLLLGAAALGACGDDEEEQEPEVETMRVVIGETTVNFGNGGCTPSVASVTIPTGGAPVTASFLKADGSPETIVTEAEFELKVEPAGRFTRTSGFAGTISGGTAGTTTFSFSLFHKEEQHEDYGPCQLPIVVQ
ncbi:MAG: hypothetical protein JNJ80_14475 [Gemmatimonadetes bacterium]|nr:hypothetical protein [Gemmatimonadota bacterium]MCC7133039.1 hypothetical protein [Gemmatimonadales bacterium]